MNIKDKILEQTYDRYKLEVNTISLDVIDKILTYLEKANVGIKKTENALFARCNDDDQGVWTEIILR